MIQRRAEEVFPGQRQRAGARTCLPRHGDTGRTATAGRPPHPAEGSAFRWLMAAAEMAGLAAANWPAPDPAPPAAPWRPAPDPAAPWRPAPDPAAPWRPAPDPAPPAAPWGTAPEPAASWRPAPEPVRPWRPRVATRTIGADAGSVRGARDFTVATLRRWGAAERGHDIALVVSELLTNALRHALPGPGDIWPRWPIRLGLLQHGSSVLCAVADPGRAVPVPQTPGCLAETGRGLQMIRALSDRWGYTAPDDAGKVVWAVFDLLRCGRAG